MKSKKFKPNNIKADLNNHTVFESPINVLTNPNIDNQIIHI